MNEVVRRERERRGLSVRAAAQAGGVSNTTWSRYEESGDVTPKMRRAVSEAFGWPAGWPEGEVDADPPASGVTPEMVADLAARFDALLSTAERRTNVVDGLVSQWERTAEQTDLLRARVEESTERGVEAIEAMARELVALREKIDRIAAFADWREATLTGAPHDRGGQ